MYNIVKQVIRYKSDTSESIPSFVGVKQGDPRSCLLCLLFLNDILENINAELDGIMSVDEIKLFLMLFASLWKEYILTQIHISHRHTIYHIHIPSKHTVMHIIQLIIYTYHIHNQSNTYITHHQHQYDYLIIQ